MLRKAEKKSYLEELGPEGQKAVDDIMRSNCRLPAYRRRYL